MKALWLKETVEAEMDGGNFLPLLHHWQRAEEGTQQRGVGRRDAESRNGRKEEVRGESEEGESRTISRRGSEKKMETEWRSSGIRRTRPRILHFHFNQSDLETLTTHLSRLSTGESIFILETATDDEISSKSSYYCKTFTTN